MKKNVFLRVVSGYLALLLAVLALPVPAFSVGQNYFESGFEPGSYEEIENDVPSVETSPSYESDFINDIVLPEELNSTFETTTGEIIVTGDGFRLQMNSDLESYCIISYIGSAKKLTIPDSYRGIPITRIGDSVFFRKGIEKVTLSENIVSMGIDVFFECENLQYNVYSGGNYIGTKSNPYYYYVSPESENVIEATVHTETRIIAKYAFRGCRNLKSVTVPGDNIIQMGLGMVFDCPVIESLTIPFVGEKKNCENNAHFGYIFGSRTYGGNISYVSQSLRTLVINGGTIAHSALYGVDMIENLTLPELSGGFLSYIFGGEAYYDNIVPASVKSVKVLYGEICSLSFYNCVHLQYIEIPEDTSYIGSDAFYGCKNLMEFSVPDGVSYIADGLFNGCESLRNIILSDNITGIGDTAFYECKSLTKYYSA